MTRPIRVLELRSVRGTGGGPEKTILLGTARTDRDRFAITVCYLRDRRDDVFGIDKKAVDLPVDYLEILERHSFDPGIWPELRRLVRERGIDIVHAHDYKTDLLALLLSRAEDVIALSTAHGWTGNSTRERWGYYPFDKWILSFFPKVIAVSSEVKEELIRFGAESGNVVTVLNGIDADAFRRDRTRQSAIRHALGVREDEFVVGAAGRAERQKRFDILIEAFAALRQAHPNARLVIAGDGSLRADLIAQTRALGLDSSCRLLGHRADVADLHHAFDLFVQSSDYEGTPNAVLEAMAMETPIVATAAGGTAEIARHLIDALIVAPGSAPTLARAMLSAASDPDGTAQRVRSARRRVETDLSFARRMRAVEAVYTELIEHRTRRNTAAPLPAPRHSSGQART